MLHSQCIMYVVMVAMYFLFWSHAGLEGLYVYSRFVCVDIFVWVALLGGQCEVNYL